MYSVTRGSGLAVYQPSSCPPTHYPYLVSEPTVARTTVSQRVTEALASEFGVDPIELEPPLYVAVDPDALDALFASTEGTKVQFDYAGHSVVVHADGAVTVTDTDQKEESQAQP